MRTGWILAVLVSGLLWTAPAEAQRLACGGHRIEWVGGGSGRTFSGKPSVEGTPRGAGSRDSAGYDTAHDDGAQPTIPEPPGLNRERWDALVFTAFGFPSPDKETLVQHGDIVPKINFCLQSADDSETGERLARHSDVSWWQRQINRWTDLNWQGELRVAACTGRPPDGWVYVRESEPGRVPDSIVASTASWRENHPHGYGRWRHSIIDWNSDHVAAMADSDFEMVLAHELGHVLGFGHVPPGSGYIRWDGRPTQKLIRRPPVYRSPPRPTPASRSSANCPNRSIVRVPSPTTRSGKPGEYLSSTTFSVPSSRVGGA